MARATKELTLEIDPTGNFSAADAYDIRSSLGLLPLWAAEGVFNGEDFQTALTSRYSYYTGPFECDDIAFEVDGSYTYPGDPISHPVARIKTNEETLYFYQNAFVAVIKKDGSTWMTRMD